MTLREKFAQAIYSFLAKKISEQIPMSALPATGRSSVETSDSTSLTKFNNRYGYLNPLFDIELINTINNLALYNPDFTQYVRNLLALGNQGHQISVTARQDSQVEQILSRINQRASDLFEHGGVDGLINHYGRQLATQGAVSSEDVVDIAGRCVKKVVLVPVSQIRFRWNEENNKFEALQKATNYVSQNGNLILLNEFTYSYMAWMTGEGSPYAIPPALGAIESLVSSQKSVIESIPHIANKQSLLGLLSVLVPPLGKIPNEIPEEENLRKNKYLEAWGQILSGNISKGLLIAFKGTEVKHTPTTSDSQAYKEIYTISEEQVFSGLNLPPPIAGRAGGITDSWAKVSYEAYKADARNIFKPAKRRHEKTLKLDLRLQGADFESVSMMLNRMPSLNPTQDNEAEKIKVETVLLKIRSGMISPDDGAVELGYESCFDPTLIYENPELAKVLRVEKTTQSNSTFVSARAIYDQDTNRYQVQREQLFISSEKVFNHDNVIELSKKKTKVLAN
ncbi:MAG: hypothetical protein MUC29_03635 [Pyrinomonadaceae bacterium]|jgi:hypothetical protein|nr:hypothetical protein [Pyrinomonadaceae bacterium]